MVIGLGVPGGLQAPNDQSLSVRMRAALRLDMNMHQQMRVTSAARSAMLNRRFCNRGSVWSSLQRRFSGWTAHWKRHALQPLCLTERHPWESGIAGEENNGSEGASSKPFQVIQNWLRGLQPSELFSGALQVGTDPARSIASVQGHRLAIRIARG